MLCGGPASGACCWALPIWPIASTRLGGRRNSCSPIPQRRRSPSWVTSPPFLPPAATAPPNQSLLGTGWGSVALLKKLDTENYNVVVISPRNFFLFTPLLPSCPTGTVEHRSIMEPIRHIIRHKKGTVQFYEADATKIDPHRRVIVVNDNSDIKGEVNETEVPFDYLVVGVGAESATFGALLHSPSFLPPPPPPG